MNFKFPEFKVGEYTWYLNKHDLKVFGMVHQINLNLTKDKVNIFYIMKNGNTFEVIPEASVLHEQHMMPSPMYLVGDTVRWEEHIKDEFGVSKIRITSDRIDKIEVYVCEDKDSKFAYEIYYYMESDPDYAVLESEIIGHAEAQQKAVYD